jgi:flagella basal body P-ring formation protein FlgA
MLLAWLALAPLAARAELVLAPGEPLTPDLVAATVREALAQRGLDGNLAVEVQAPSAPLANRASSPTRLVVGELRYEPRTGRYDAKLLASLATGEATTILSSGRIDELVEAAVLARPIGRGETIGPQDVIRRELPLGSVGADAFREPGELVGLQAARPLAAGRAVRAKDLVAPLLVRRGEPASMVLRRGGLELIDAAIALDHGRQDEWIRVQNAASGEIRRAVVTGPRRVEVAPEGAAP